MATDFAFENYNKKKKNALFRIFIFSLIEITFINIYFIISAITGVFDWTVELLTTTGEGFIIQIIRLVATVIGIYIFIEIMVYVALILNAPDEIT
ncbi:MAG: hypothetical protein EU552_00430 [Promethearchaeota archaeon]|jgi:hypothetical protein|nr:MAG: hypothetical protein EU552_00430 [Candidatus Lokiarchaeota archaeon]